MNDVDDSDHELTDEQRDKLRKAIGEIIGDFTPWILCVDTTPIIKYSNDLLDGSEAFVYGVIMQARLLDHIIDHCRSMLGYSGSMPSEVPNQSEDAEE